MYLSVKLQILSYFKHSTVSLWKQQLMLQNLENYDELLWAINIYSRAYYLSWPQSATVDFAKSSFSKQIFITEWTCCLFHLLECENRWSMQPFCRSWYLIFKLPKLCRFVNPWIECPNVISWSCNETALSVQAFKAREEEKRRRKYRGLCDPQTCFDDACSRLRPNQMAWLALAYLFCFWGLKCQVLTSYKWNMQLDGDD